MIHPNYKLMLAIKRKYGNQRAFAQVVNGYINLGPRP